MRKAVFLDKDGTIMDDVPYNADPSLVRFKPGTFAALRKLQAAGYALVIVSNQSGVARGKFTQADLDNLIEEIGGRLAADDIWLDGFYCCTHSPEDRCLCRKPAHGLLIDAATDLDLCLTESWMVGDKVTDTQAGKSAGCKTILLDGITLMAAADMIVTIDAITRIEAKLDALNAKLDGLIEALAEDDDDEVTTLDGSTVGLERTDSRSL